MYVIRQQNEEQIPAKTKIFNSNLRENGREAVKIISLTLKSKQYSIALSFEATEFYHYCNKLKRNQKFYKINKYIRVRNQLGNFVTLPRNKSLKILIVEVESYEQKNVYDKTITIQACDQLAN